MNIHGPIKTEAVSPMLLPMRLSGRRCQKAGRLTTVAHKLEWVGPGLPERSLAI